MSHYKDAKITQIRVWRYHNFSLGSIKIPGRTSGISRLPIWGYVQNSNWLYVVQKVYNYRHLCDKTASMKHSLFGIGAVEILSEYILGNDTVLSWKSSYALRLRSAYHNMTISYKNNISKTFTSKWLVVFWRDADFRIEIYHVSFWKHVSITKALTVTYHIGKKEDGPYAEESKVLVFYCHEWKDATYKPR